ncbi:hypothetical protein DL98DRAFT_431749 [Cadophora sp. DSE1049]|nr:hypothetical protein DL98DRAFT_431749 [Cadophora sp. DSE1049]
MTSRPADGLETPPNPSIIIPFSRDEEFVDRATLDQIHQKCAIPGSRIALVGLGGVGKSQLAIEYAYRTRERVPETWVFWVHASNTARFEQSFREVADRVKIVGRQNPTANIFQLVHDWLCDDRKGKWVLILDNVDDAGFLVEVQRTGQERQTSSIESGNPRSLVSYLPQCSHGSILITTRSEDEAIKLVEPRDIITIEPMSSKDALKLFETKLGADDDGRDDADAAEFLVALEFMPLAIVQAAAYISRRKPRYSLRKYLNSFRESDRKRTSLLDYNGQQLRRDREAKNSIINTWQISFDHIRKIRPSAGDLLSLMSFFDRQGIPDTLLQNESKLKKLKHDQRRTTVEICDDSDTGDSDSDADITSQSSLNERFEEDVSVLRNYSFITVNASRTTFEMHGLVQLATRKWLEAHGQIERWKHQFIMNLDAKLPTGKYENWERCQALFPHAQSAAAQRPKEQDFLLDWASVLYKAAWYAWEMGKGVEAETMAVNAMKVRKKILGDKHSDTLDGMAMVGLACKLNGQWDDAEKLEVQVMETRKTKLGVDHPDTLMSMGNLASTMGNLASTYRNQGRWDDAKELEVQVMETRKTKLGVDYPDTLTSMNNLAFTWKGNGKDIEAVRLMEDCVRVRKRLLGLNHPHSISSCTALDAWKAEQEDVVL